MNTVAAKKDETRERVINVFRAIYGNDYHKAETDTNIGAAKWKRMCNRLQYPTLEMLASFFRLYPYFIAWAFTGEDRITKQLSPLTDWKKELAEAVRIDDGVIG